MLQLGFEPEQQLCLALLHADTEQEVIDILRSHGYWDDPNVWRAFGDDEGNFSTIGNQSDNPEAALVEKLINAVDAVLMGECMAAGIPPNASHAPRTIPEAVAMFMHGDRHKANTLGHVSYWSRRQRREVSDRITLAATGARSNPCITIVDSGEGQTPLSMPDTLLSLGKRNKIDIHFVQGKFNMGGTGALRFCGEQKLELIVSKRNPHIKLGTSGEDSYSQWGFTIVRREDAKPNERVSTYKYLAPNNKVLSFPADSLPLFPQGNNAYVRNAEWGTAIKLYEYKLTGKSNILLSDGLLSRLDLLLPEAALPIRLHECRDYKGHPGSFDTTLTGLGIRLSDDRNENLEPGFPSSCEITIAGEKMSVSVYAFKRGKADAYRKREGIIFTLNGQTHAQKSKAFFGRTAVGMSSLEESLLVIVDCSRMSVRSREDFFLNSRDRIAQGEFLRKIEEELTDILKNNQDLRDLSARRRNEDIASKLKDSKPFEDVLKSIFSKSPSLALLLGGTGRLPNPFRPEKIKKGKEFAPRLHPSYFRFQNKKYGHVLKRTTPLNMRSRVIFETDVANDYFDRRQSAGEHILRTSYEGATPNHTLNPHSGAVTLTLALPEGAREGDSFTYESIVQDETLVEPFINQFVISVGPPQKPSGSSGKHRKRSTGGRGEEEIPQGLALPKPVPVYESEWEKYGFDKLSSLKIVHYPSDTTSDSGTYDYFINMDNIHLNTELKATKEDPEILKARWTYGVVLIGMSLLKDVTASQQANLNGHLNEGDDELSPMEFVGKTVSAIAPVLLPLIEHLGALSDEDVRN